MRSAALPPISGGSLGGDTRDDLHASLRAVVNTLGALPVPWAIAGGWAIDLALGRVTREHADVDVAMFREDQGALHAALPGWELAMVVDHTFHPWPRGVVLAPSVFEIHARPPAGTDEPGLELLLNERDGTDWVYRRDPAVRRPLALALRVSPFGPRVLAPEIVLLYKSKAPRAGDEHDLRVAQPLLDTEARAWLRAAIERAAPEHPWLTALAVEE